MWASQLTDHSVPQASSFLRITRLCGGVMEQQAVTAHHSDPRSSRNIICDCVCVCVPIVWSQETTHWATAWEAAGLAGGRLSGQQRQKAAKRLNDSVADSWRSGLQLSVIQQLTRKHTAPYNRPLHKLHLTQGNTILHRVEKNPS